MKISSIVTLYMATVHALSNKLNRRSVTSMESLIDLSDANSALDLKQIRFQLIRLEDSITFHLIERVQFPLNKNIYVSGAVKIPNSTLSFMDWCLWEQERVQSLIRRYESPDEYPFFPEALQSPILPSLNYPRILNPNDVNVNTKIKEFYTEHFLPAACPKPEHGDRGAGQENYGSSATADIACLQALSRRIHFGKFVAESKFRSEEKKYTEMIKAGDRQGIGKAITNEAVEKQVLDRLRLKVQTYGRDPITMSEHDIPSKINVEAVVSMYRDYVIPLTKEVEVEYLMQRLQPAA
ncbi:hypothetical protein MCOR27_007442 [Pyricularia oryzae]|uniref:Chorismate mutase n=6 Tax=Pyricularia TaxID=48558 RepID=A0ABQ8NAN3_PYRGI|nr:chorismate mutase [Pyricularia oryzae Y34]KAH8839128.1 hypothetical protein MCOR01_008352 [Pyricularia oryzae]KAI6293140.1 hypothetical protein MCOR33_009357 [Pyricularia grisea]KAH9438969.1 hypothetical protein MCOR02_002553 [Pyricularia oryzae]KAI6253024.1 hypothetical protein MCOR19_010392 [Pyricularia oryzae]